ncbi:GNAT family N-acetyltransferase [Labilibacter marinus]|uniref:GNAT family N-acetyltransferase n=1 Tax=Labilibacter marinus TaxID=1477105 RepID=UPI00082BA217|nr:GNAT family N-acetyltransferase [Labilibacter marinus]
MLYETVKSSIFFLKMDKKPSASLIDKEGTSIEEIAKPIDTDWYRALYSSVGENLNWLDRTFMKDDVLQEKINCKNTHIFCFKIEGKHAGYCELVQEDDSVEILYFGLTPEFIGQGYGKYFLNKTIELAWSLCPKFIELNTCDLDHPNALSTYKKAGFTWYKTIVEEKKIKKLL